MRKPIDNVNQKAMAGEASASAGPACAASQGDELMELVHNVMHQWRSRQYQALRAAQALPGGEDDEELTHMERKVLGYFDRHPGATQRDLAQHSGRDKAQLARLIKALRDRGLLDAAPDAADRRAVRLRLTPEGEAVQLRLQELARQVGTRAVAGLAAAEHLQLVALLRRVQDNLLEDVPPGAA